jgi:hypothetical protein
MNLNNEHKNRLIDIGNAFCKSYANDIIKLNQESIEIDIIDIKVEKFTKIKQYIKHSSTDTFFENDFIDVQKITLKNNMEYYFDLPKHTGLLFINSYLNNMEYNYSIADLGDIQKSLYQDFQTSIINSINNTLNNANIFNSFTTYINTILPQVDQNYIEIEIGVQNRNSTGNFTIYLDLSILDNKYFFQSNLNYYDLNKELINDIHTNINKNFFKNVAQNINNYLNNIDILDNLNMNNKLEVILTSLSVLNQDLVENILSYLEQEIKIAYAAFKPHIQLTEVEIYKTLLFLNHLIVIKNTNSIFLSKDRRSVSELVNILSSFNKDDMAIFLSRESIIISCILFVLINDEKLGAEIMIGLNADVQIEMIIRISSLKDLPSHKIKNILIKTLSLFRKGDIKQIPFYGTSYASRVLIAIEKIDSNASKSILNMVEVFDNELKYDLVENINRLKK